MDILPKENKNIPDFLKDAAPQATPEALTERVAVQSPLLKPFVIVSGLWFLCLLAYVQFSFGWGSLAALMPAEFAGFLAIIFISLAIILLLTAFIFRAALTANQAALVEKSLNQVLYSQNNNMLSDIMTRALQAQINDLTNAAKEMAQQTKTLQQTLTLKTEEFHQFSDTLNLTVAENVEKFGQNAQTLLDQCRQAADIAGQTAEDFAQKTDKIRHDAAALTEELNPLINETLATAEHLKNIANENRQYITQSNAGINEFSEQSRQHLENLSGLIESHNTKFEKTILQTADNCEEIYKRLDSGISHIENSLTTHKQLAAEQSALLDKNSAYLDGKLGEYGRLISMEVEAMIERSSTLDTNVKSQLKTLSAARESINQILDGANNSLEQKTAKAVKNIEKIMTTLDAELSKLNDFIKKTESKNTEVQNAAEKITRQIGTLSSDLGQKVDDLKTRAVEAIDKFNEVSGVVQKNTLQLTETANVIVRKGHEGAESLENQQQNIINAVQELANVKERIFEIRQDLQQTSDSTAGIFENYKTHIAEFGSLINRQVELLNESRQHSEQQLSELKKKYDELSVDNFIDASADLIKSLENLSIDVNRFVENDEEDDLWKKFYTGDHAVFARHIVRNISRKQIVRIREEYEKNTDFRQLTDRYISDFETLTNVARGSEKPEVLLSLLSGTDIGRIYYILARALDRLN